jgi:hypothetical protein
LTPLGILVFIKCQCTLTVHCFGGGDGKKNLVRTSHDCPYPHGRMAEILDLGSWGLKP